MKKYFIAANFKMNKDNEEVASFINSLKKKPLRDNADIVVFPSFVSIITAFDCAKESSIKIGAQNMFFADKGAFTGEVSPLMIKDFCEYVIIGHSERRHIFKETNALISKKVAAAIKNRINVVLCIGETLFQRESSKTYPVLKNQLSTALKGIDPSIVGELIIAYEPVWAIGTGKTESANDIKKAAGFIKKTISNLGLSKKTRIIYGGSVNKSNIKDIMSIDNIDGVLVGHASLDLDSFVNIINF